MNINIVFCRKMLADVHRTIRRAFPDVDLNKTISQVGPHGRDQYFVQIDVPGFPKLDDYYSADNAYDAKAQAWMKFFDKHAPKQIKRQIMRELDDIQSSQVILQTAKGTYR